MIVRRWDRALVLFVGMAPGLAAFSVSTVEAQIHHPATPHASVVAGEVSGVATVTVQGGRLMELSLVQGGTIRVLYGITWKEVTDLLGNPYFTSLLEKAGVLRFDEAGRLMRPGGDEDEGVLRYSGYPELEKSRFSTPLWKNRGETWPIKTFHQTRFPELYPPKSTPVLFAEPGSSGKLLWSFSVNPAPASFWQLIVTEGRWIPSRSSPEAGSLR